MQLVKIGFLKKSNVPVFSFLRNTSCSNGWLRLVVQIIFGVLIVTSFILIMLMAIGGPYRSLRSNTRCSITSCSVVCNDAPFYGDREDDIVNAASEASVNCESIELKLNRPTFINSVVPEYFLSRICVKVRGLTITGGNIRHIPPHTFITPFGSNIKTLALEDIEISLWENNMLMGLSNLLSLVIKDCILGEIRNGGITAIDDHLELIDIKAINFWNPTNLTGSLNSNLAKLSVVNFSSNKFYSILKNTSFSSLKQCKVLFLNSCGINTIGPGTFDHLTRIEVLYLNDNYLVTIPVGLFDKILPIKPRIALHNNFWHCDCSVNDLRTVFHKGLLIIDPICRFPDAVNGLTFSEFEGYCQKYVGTNEGVVVPIFSNDSHLYPCHNISRIFYIDAACHEENSSSISLIKELNNEHRCMLSRISNKDLESVVHDHNIETFKVVDWIKPVYSIQSRHYSMVEIEASAMIGLGLLWYQSTCVNEVSCLHFIPNTLKVYNVNSGIQYVFCPFNLSSGEILNELCVSFNLENFEQNVVCTTSNNHAVILYSCVSVGCLICGAILVYALIHKNPTLLKGNNRVIFVKHKSIEALILPPQLPKRNKSIDGTRKSTKHVFEKQKIFLLPDNFDTLSPQNFIRSVSMRSSESNEASYISPLQPTEEQLTEWRSNQIVKQSENAPTTELDTSSSSSSIYERESLPYYSCHTTERIYEIPKQC